MLIRSQFWLKEPNGTVILICAEGDLEVRGGGGGGAGYKNKIAHSDSAPQLPKIMSLLHSSLKINGHSLQHPKILGRASQLP